MAEGMPNFDPTAKIGKFPVWVWGAGLAGGVLVFTWASRQKEGKAAVPAGGLTETTGDLPEVSGGGLGGAGDDTQGMLSDFLANLTETLGGVTDPTGGTVSPGGAASGIRTVTATTNAGGVVSTLQTNQGWASAAVGYLASKGRDALGSERIIRAYLAGKPLSAHSRQVVAQAISGVGTAPKGAPPVINKKPAKTIKVKPKKPKPKPKPKPKKKVKRWRNG